MNVSLTSPQHCWFLNGRFHVHVRGALHSGITKMRKVFPYYVPSNQIRFWKSAPFSSMLFAKIVLKMDPIKQTDKTPCLFWTNEDGDFPKYFNRGIVFRFRCNHRRPRL